jgi:anti-sigma factor RsiW
MRNLDLNCNEMKNLVHPYVDGELDLVRNLEIEEHLQACSACAQACKGKQALQTALRAGSLRFKAPTDLQKRIRASLQRASKPERIAFPVPWRMLAVAASLMIVALTTWGLARTSLVPPANDFVAREVVYSHVRSLLAKEPVDIVSSNQHTVKPWFTGKLDFAPTVKDLTEQGFPLIGGRVDYLDDRQVAALLYGRHQHKINLFIWPSAKDSDVEATTQTRQGYHLIHWAASGMTFWAISDLNTAELQQFMQLIQK